MSKIKENSSTSITDGDEEITRKSIEKDGITKSIEVRKVENGYVISVNEYGEDNKGKWYSHDKTYVSKTNPLTKEEEGEKEKEPSFKEMMAEALKNLKI